MAVVPQNLDSRVPARIIQGLNYSAQQLNTLIAGNEGSQLRDGSGANLKGLTVDDGIQ